MPPAIETTDLVKEYGDLRAIDDLSLRVESGEFFGLLGPNGAGKTTFINVLVGLARQSAGQAAVFGHDVETEYRQARDAIGLAPQEFNVDRFFPIEEVLMHKAGYHGVPRERARERARETLRTVGIYEKRETRFDWLSGGMKRRFLLARAMVTDPDLLILDEPTAGVDVQLRRELWALITELNESGTTILLTTHYIEEAERLCDRVAILDHGRKVEVATPEELRERGTDRLRIELSGPLRESAIGTIEAIEGVHAASVEGETVTVHASGAGHVAPPLLNAIEATGVEVLDLDIQRASLEEAFVEMTGGGASVGGGEQRV